MGEINKGIETFLPTSEPGEHHPETAVNKCLWASLDLLPEKGQEEA